MRFRHALPLVALLVMCARTAHADDAGEARKLFDQGRQLLAEGKIDEACKKLEASFALDAGAGTKFNLASCYERAGRVASAWAAYNEVASMTQARGETDRAEVARNRAIVLVTRLSWLTIVVPNESRVDGLAITRDAAHVPSTGWGTNLPVDIGKHTIGASAPDRSSWSTSVTLEREGQVIEVVVPVLGEASHEPSSPPAFAAPPARDQPSTPKGSTWRKRLGQGLLGGGVIALGVGTFFGVRSLSRWSDAEPFCNGNSCQDPGFDLRNDSIRDGDLATGILATGIVLAGAGAVLWLTSR